MRPVIDHDLCTGCELCVDTCPEVFVMREDGLAYVLTEHPDIEDYDCTREAADLCPVDAITIQSD